MHMRVRQALCWQESAAERLCFCLRFFVVSLFARSAPPVPALLGIRPQMVAYAAPRCDRHILQAASLAEQVPEDSEPVCQLEAIDPWL